MGRRQVNLLDGEEMASLRLGAFSYQVFLTGPDLQPRQLLGTAFPIAPSGDLMTCRHVTDVNKGDDDQVGVFDGEVNRMVLIEEIRYPQRSDLDIALLPNALGRPKKEFYPILSPEHIMMGLDVYSVGFFVGEGIPNVGYFKGHVVNLTQSEGRTGFTDMSLSYPVIDGLSGSPVVTYHNGPKLVGLCHGSLQSRIAPSEILEYQDERLTLKETVTRIVELGKAHHATVLIEFLKEADAQGYIVSAERVPGIFE